MRTSEITEQRLNEFLDLLSNAAADAAGVGPDDADKFNEIRDAVYAAYNNSLYLVDVRLMGVDIEPKCRICGEVMSVSGRMHDVTFYRCNDCGESVRFSEQFWPADKKANTKATSG